jgi:peptide/nickel transport system permease protein
MAFAGTKEMRRTASTRWASLMRLFLIRLAQMLLVAVVVVLVAFLLVRLVPGNPAQAILGLRASPKAVAALTKEMGLDRSLPSQLALEFDRLLHGSLGASLAQPGQSVLGLIAPHLLTTLSVIACALAYSLVVGIPAALIGALGRFRLIDRLLTTLAMILLALPPFLLGLVLLLVASLKLHLAPAGGWAGSWPANLRYLWLPGLALAGFVGPLIFRTARRAARDAAAQDFVEAALARGLSEPRVLLRHVLPNASLPVITLVGFNVGALLAGAVVIEAVFALPGIGTDLVNAVAARDYPVIQGVALLTGLVVVTANLLTDLLYALVDPRIARRDS